jgi:copper chaperone
VRTRSYIVNGMTCEHCRAAVIEEVTVVGGVERAVVDLASGTLDVEGESFTDAEIAAAVDAAGYDLAEAPL